MSRSVERLRAEVVSRVASALERVAPAGSLVAAVSGGADSVALAWALGQLRARWPLAGLAFVDHGLRDVARERRAVRALAGELETTFFERRVALEPGNLQASARRARYRVLIAIARTCPGRALVATGHTLSDQAETVLARLLRGAGLPGLSGLAPRRGRIVRPLLEVSRDETRALGLDFVDDPSNGDPRFQRNRLRALLVALGPERERFERALADLARQARTSTRILDALAGAASEVSLEGLDEETIATWLVHRGRHEGARGFQRRALKPWVRALREGRAASFSLGQGLRGLAQRGQAAIAPDRDPRGVVVAWRPGTYRGTAMEMAITTSDTHTEPEAAHAARLPVDTVQWPLTLERAGPREPGVGGDELDFERGTPVGGWRVVDGAGRTLVPPTERAIGRGREGHWIRVVLRPLGPRSATEGL